EIGLENEQIQKLSTNIKIGHSSRGRHASPPPNDTSERERLNKILMSLHAMQEEFKIRSVAVQAQNSLVLSILRSDQVSQYIQWTHNNGERIHQLGMTELAALNSASESNPIESNDPMAVGMSPPPSIDTR